VLSPPKTSVSGWNPGTIKNPSKKMSIFILAILQSSIPILRIPAGHRKNGKCGDSSLTLDRPLDERPAVVDEKSSIGDWEIDTAIGKGH